MIGPAAELDIAGLARRQAPAIGVDDGEVMIGQWLADGAEAALFARYSGDPARLAGAAALGHGNPEFLLEPFPLFDQERCRARRNEAQFWQGVAMRTLFAVEQNVDRRRIAGGDGHIVLAQMP